MRGNTHYAASLAALAISLIMAPTISAQDAGASEGVASDIIVTARRREENLQDIPQTVNAVSGATLERLNLQKFEDIQTIVPGLTLTSGSSGYSTAATIRGASFVVESSATPTVEFYLNDALIQSIFLFQSMYDVGQIEVLRGPQGTLRGRASPSGAITVTTRRPDLNQAGGFVNLTGMTRGGVNANGAFNLPIIDGVLAVRVAGIVDQNQYDFIRRIDGRHPSASTASGRISLAFEPSDFLSANIMYQHLERDTSTFKAVESLSLIDPSAPVVAPVIAARDRRGITDGASTSTLKQDVVTAQIETRFAGQKLSYTGSYSKGGVFASEAQDFGNIFPGREWYLTSDIHMKQWTHEVRLASEERLFDFLDYTIGVFNSDFDGPVDVVSPTAVTLFGNLVQIVDTPTQRVGTQKETSFFGNVTAHLGERTELSGGVRKINYKDAVGLIVNGIQLVDRSVRNKPMVYNASISHRFSDDFLAYANTGSSWRGGPFLIGVFRPLTPRLENYLDLQPEKSKAYEIGFKATMLDKRVRLNVAAFKQDFDGFIYRGVPVYYVDLTATGPRTNTFNFGSNVDSKIKGFDVDAAFQVTPRLSVSTTFSYAKGKIKDQFIACTDLDGDGNPDANPPVPTVAQITASAGGEAVAQCKVNDPTAFAPKWTLTAQSEYSAPITAGMDGYVRGLLTFYPQNRQDPNNPYDNVVSYGLFNAYVGIRSPDGAWEVSLFVKNLTATSKVLNRSNGVVTTAVQALQPPTFSATIGQSIPSSYLNASFTAPRQFGLNVRYAFGSR